MRLLFCTLLACAYHPASTPTALQLARRSVPVVAAQALGPDILVGIRAGSAFDPPGREGTAWLAASVIAIHAGVEVEVGPEVVVFRVPPERLDGFTAVLAHPAVEESLVALQPEQRWTAWSRDCISVANAAYDRWLYAGHPYSHPTVGRSSVIPTLTATELRNFMAARYVRSAVMVLAEKPELVGNRFDFLPAVLTRSPTPTQLPPMPQSRFLIVEAPVQDTCAVVGNRLGDQSATERASIALIRALWEDLTVQPVRLQDGLRLHLPSLMGGDGVVAALGALDRLASEGIDPQEAARARDLAWSRIASDWGATALGSVLLPGLPSVQETATAFQSITPDDIQKSASKLLSSDNRWIVIVTDDTSTLQGIEGFPALDVIPTVTATELFQ